MNETDFLYDTLTETPTAITYRALRSLAALRPGAAILPSDNTHCDVAEFARAGLCRMEPRHDPLPQFDFNWWTTEQGIARSCRCAWWDIIWEGQRLELVQAQWPTPSGCDTEYKWLIASTQETAERFFSAVCEWNAEVRGEVLVFSGGHWHKSEELYHAVRSATFDNLILPEGLKQELQTDLAQFFSSREVYEHYRIPWKRGLLLVGPPGNGKTHTIKALINWLGKPCLYVKTLKPRYGSDHQCIAQVFERARRTTPCLLVMEDLDSLITDKNRSFFLNELDGFASNTGIVLVATTNHPERLDPAIVDRPSRFDRKYHFHLPAEPERTAYMEQWNVGLEPEMRLSDAGRMHITAATEGFSFAYLKELFLSSMMRWINAPQPGGMDEIMLAQCRVLRDQMASQIPAPPPSPEDDEDDYDEDES